MNAHLSRIEKPQRWQDPLDPDISESNVDHLLKINPFSAMDPEAFSKSVPLRGILKNDCRLHKLNQGDIIVREGDYGSSAFLILSGKALVSLVKLPDALLGRVDGKAKGWLGTLAQLWQNSSVPEVRDYRKPAKTEGVVGQRQEEDGTRVFLHDIPRVIPAGSSVELSEGEIFGEISALTRTPRSATVVANSEMVLLEIRWQGFRDLLKRHEALRQHVDGLYRENSLKTHLREIELLKDLPTINEIADETVFESFGEFQWNLSFKSMSRKDVSERILSEPVIANQGEYVGGLILIRNGFARLSRQHGDGHQTIAYLGKGETFGFRELAHNWRTQEQVSWSLSLRAVGYVDILRIPTGAVEKLILPHIPEKQLPPPISGRDNRTNSRRKSVRRESMDRGLMEFLVGGRFINGKQTMMIDLDRCTRCDDCVRACASTHDNNPRFIRHGPKHDHWMVTNACMHCLDPVCMIGCPTGAIGRDEETGTVTINDQTCIGCSTCANSCPYHNIQMVEINDRKGAPIVDQESGKPILKATKCDLCASHMGGPACQRACPHDALVRIDMTDTDDVTHWSKR